MKLTCSRGVGMGPFVCGSAPQVIMFTCGGAIYSLALDSRDQLYSASRDRSIRVWSVTDFSLLRTLEGHTGGVRTLVIDKDGTLCSGSDDCTIRVWSGIDGAPIQALEGHTSAVISSASAPNGFSATSDGAIRVRPAQGHKSMLVAMPRVESHWLCLIFTDTGRLWVSYSSVFVY